MAPSGRNDFEYTARVEVFRETGRSRFIPSVWFIYTFKMKPTPPDYYTKKRIVTESEESLLVLQESLDFDVCAGPSVRRVVHKVEERLWDLGFRERKT